MPNAPEQFDGILDDLRQKIMPAVIYLEIQDANDYFLFYRSIIGNILAFTATFHMAAVIRTLLVTHLLAR